MEAIDFLQALYSPTQPTVGNSDLQVVYQETKPSAHLSKYIHCFWQLKTNKRLTEDYQYRVVSDGCIDIFVDADQPKASFVMGFYSKYHTFPIGKVFNYIGIRFYPSVFPLYFNISAKKLSNKVTPLHEINQDLSVKLGEMKLLKAPLDEIATFFNQVLGQFLNGQNLEPDLRFHDALKLILEKNGVLETESDLNTGLSPRQLRRVFNHHIGTTPKSFCKVVRFQFILNTKPSRQSLKDNKLFYDAGFYDQAHFIKDFKNFYGVTPTQAFRSGER